MTATYVSTLKPTLPHHQRSPFIPVFCLQQSRTSYYRPIDKVKRKSTLALPEQRRKRNYGPQISKLPSLSGQIYFYPHSSDFRSSVFTLKATCRFVPAFASWQTIVQVAAERELNTCSGFSSPCNIYVNRNTGGVIPCNFRPL